ANGGLERPRKAVATLNIDGIESQPPRHRPQLSGERVGDSAGIGSSLNVGRQREQPARGAVGFEINASDQTLAEQKRQHVIAPAALLLRREYLDAVIDPKEPRSACTIPDYRVERRQQRRGFDSSGDARIRVKISRLTPSFDPRLAQFSRPDQFGDAPPSFPNR